MKAIKTEEDFKKFYKAFREVYGEGIYIKSNMHPCGWDWVDLSGFYDVYDMMEEPLTIDDFSNGNYDWHTYEGWSPFQMLKDLEENWAFEIEDIDWV